MNTLHITNGDSAARIMQRAGITGEILAWRDILHEGPVTIADDLQALSKQRAKFIAQQGWGEYADILTDFRQRDTILARIMDYAGVILWFEHDLYDQLQLLQILSWLNRHSHNGITVSLIWHHHYLGMLSPDEMADLRGTEKPVSTAQLQLADLAWQAFCSPSPLPWLALLKSDTTALKFLRGNILRLLEEYPTKHTGLNRTERQILEIVASGESRSNHIFEQNQQREERRFMGDTSFCKLINRMLISHPPLLTLSGCNTLRCPLQADYRLTLTSGGEAVLQGRRNWTEITPPDYWLGGVKLTANAFWYWDADQQRLLAN